MPLSCHLRLRTAALECPVFFKTILSIVMNEDDMIALWNRHQCKICTEDIQFNYEMLEAHIRKHNLSVKEINFKT